MNQILQVQENRKNSTSKPVDVKKIVIFFAVCIIIFGLFFAGQGIMVAVKNKQNEKIPPVEETPGSDVQEEPQYIPPVITLTKTEENKAVIKVESQQAISHIIYDWNSGTGQTLEETGKTNIEEVIEIPVGENVLNVSVIDSDGIETKKSEKYILELPKPVIELSVVGSDIKITVTSEIELSYITYKWNSEQEKKQDMNTFEDRKKFEKQLEIPKGQNTLKIVAVDINQSKSEKSQEIKGITKAKTKTVVKGGYLYFTVTGDENIKTVEFTFNGTPYIMNKDTYGETKVVQYRVKLIDGWNYLKIISTTDSGAQDTSLWKYEYKPR